MNKIQQRNKELNDIIQKERRMYSNSLIVLNRAAERRIFLLKQHYENPKNEDT